MKRVVKILCPLIAAMVVACVEPTRPAENKQEHSSEGCEQGSVSTPPKHTTAVVEQKGTGEVTAHLGQPFTSAPVVTVSELLASSDKHRGKRVTVIGDVTAMCHHRRGWFAMTGKDQSGDQIRVLTMPHFKVPPESIGKSAKAEGVVDVIQVSPRMAQHLAEGHKLPDPGPTNQPIQRVVLRATAAEFVAIGAK